MRSNNNWACCLPATHRALDDARATHGVYVELLKLIRQLPVDLIAEIVRYGEEVDWGGKLAFREALAEAAKEPIGAKQAHGIVDTPAFPASSEAPARTAHPGGQAHPSRSG